jgi:hypothetical protein
VRPPLALPETDMPPMADIRQQVVTGLVPPSQGEAMIRQVFPSVAAFPAVATLGRVLIRSIILAPLAWLLLAPIYFLKVLPFIGRRYTLTNRSLMVRRGLQAVSSHSIPLADIDDVRLREDDNSAFFRSGTLDVVSKDRVVLELPGVPEPESFRQAIMSAVKAWVPGKASAGEFIPASASKKA